MSATTRVCLIGFGEVGQAFARDLLAREFHDLVAWDVQLPDPRSAPSRAIATLGVRRATDLADALRDAELIVCAVTAVNCAAVATSVAAIGLAGTYFLDLNSVAPDTKCDAAQRIEQGGGRYVEAAVMSPIAPRGITSPILLGGPHAQAFLARASAFGLAGASLYSPVLGRASAAKMCRSVMVKGIESLLTESLIAARHYGVEKTVLASLSDLFPVGDWPKLAQYMISRSLEHGTRRAEEMREVARTVSDAGLAPLLSAATAERQDWSAARKAALDADTLPDLLDRLLDLRNDPKC